MEAHNMNQSLWQKNLNHRDNGAVSVGSIIRMMCPMPIESYMRNDTPIVQSPYPVILLKFPTCLFAISMNQEIEANASLAFVYNNTQASINMVFPTKKSCSGNFCDCQRVNDWNGSRGCGCYGMSQNSSSLVFKHAIDISTATNSMSMSEFLSLKFSQLYLSGDIPGSCKLYMLQYTDAAMNMQIAVEECVETINNNGGFTVIGWYKRGIINDQSLLEARKIVSNNNTSNNNGNNRNEELQVDAGEISYHFVHIFLTNRNFLDPTTTLGQLLKGKKYNVTGFDNMQNN
jgi:hypothetical protein